MMNLSLTLFVLLPLLLLFWILYTFLFKDGKGRFTFKIGKGKGIRNLFIYLILLIAAAVASLLLVPGPSVQLGAEKKVSEYIIYDLIERNADKQEFEKFLRKRDTFDFSGSELAIRMPQGGIQTVVNEHGEPGVVEASYYETPSIIMETLDITDELPLPDVTLRNGNLTVEIASVNLEYAGYKPVFAFEQFQKKGTVNPFYSAYGITDSYEFSGGEGLLYITVPEKVDVKNTDGAPVEYIGE